MCHAAAPACPRAARVAGVARVADGVSGTGRWVSRSCASYSNPPRRGSRGPSLGAVSVHATSSPALADLDSAPLDVLAHQREQRRPGRVPPRETNRAYVTSPPGEMRPRRQHPAERRRSTGAVAPPSDPSHAGSWWSPSGERLQHQSRASCRSTARRGGPPRPGRRRRTGSHRSSGSCRRRNPSFRHVTRAPASCA